jgi:Ca2+-binding EF-hand superfamily protein
MGGNNQKVHLSQVSNVYAEVRPLMASKKQFSSLGLTENDVGEIYTAFSSIDVDNSYEITLGELLLFIQAEETPFFISIFRAFDANNNKKIDIREFIFAVWNYCTLNHTRLCKPSFFLIT